MQIDQKTLVQTGFKSEVTEKLVSLEKKESLSNDSQPSLSGKLEGRRRNSEI